MVNYSRLHVAVAAATLVEHTNAFNFDMGKYMKIQAMRNQFTEDKIDNSQQNALMKVAGFDDMELFLSKQISADELRQSMKAEFKDKLITDIMTGGGIDISNPMWRRKFFDDKSDAELFTESLPEPMQSILRLIRENEEDTAIQGMINEYGRTLLKKYQYKSFNKAGSVFSENMDEILMADNKKDVIKKLMKQQMLNQIVDPLDRAMMYNMQQQTSTTDLDEKKNLRADLKDLQTIKLFSNSVPQVSPVNSDDLYAFYQIATQQEINEADMLNAALGEPLQGISELDFERYFGSSAKQFSCRSHPSRLRVPCGINPSADECLASGCCYNPTGGDESTPSCYHDLYGKIGSGMLRQAFIEGDDERSSTIKNLFRNSEIPTLTRLLKEDYSKFVEEPELFPKKEQQEANWWDAAKVTGENNVEAHLIKQEPRQQYGRPGFQWKAHGPTASPYLERYPGVNPTAMPGGDSGLDTYYQMWLSYTDTLDQAECALIHPDSRVKCMENYDALVDYKVSTKENRESTCKQAGCCFNEEGFLEGGHACYRASDYGTCTQLPSNFVKKECGYDGVSETECLTNARCCYKPTHIAGEPWCFYKYSATLEEDEWCEAWNLLENRNKARKPCWETNKKSNLFTNNNLNDDNLLGDINNLVSQEQCEAADCCYDAELTADALDWIIEGLGQNNLKYRCFAKENPAIYTEINRSEDGDGNPLKPQSEYENEDLRRTCDVTRWGADNIFKKSCGDSLSYYQCVYVNKCCYKATTTNEPACYEPQIAV